MKYVIVFIFVALVSWIAFDLVRGMREDRVQELKTPKERKQVLLPQEASPVQNGEDPSLGTDAHWAAATEVKRDENAPEPSPEQTKKRTLPDWWIPSDDNFNNCRKAVENLIETGKSATPQWCDKHIGEETPLHFDPTDYFLCHAILETDFGWCDLLAEEPSRVSCRIESMVVLMAKLLLLEKADVKAFQVRLVKLGMPEIKEWSGGYELAWRLVHGEIDDEACLKAAKTETDRYSCLLFGNKELSPDMIARHEDLSQGVRALKTGKTEWLEPLDLRNKTVFFSLLSSKNYCDDMARHEVLSLCNASYPLPYLETGK